MRRVSMSSWRWRRLEFDGGRGTDDGGRATGGKSGTACLTRSRGGAENYKERLFRPLLFFVFTLVFCFHAVLRVLRASAGSA
jgi:hypothetical protein